MRPWRLRSTTPPTGRKGATAAVLLSLVSVLAACSATSTEFTGPPVGRVGPRVTYLAVIDGLALPRAGAGTTSSPALLTQAMPPWTTSYEAVAMTGADEFTSLTRSGGIARSVRPTVVTVSSGMGALFDGVSSSQFASVLGGLLVQLRAAGAVTILVGNLVPADLSPWATRCLRSSSCPLAPSGITWTPAGLDDEILSYDEAIARQAAADGAVLVDLHGAIEKAIGQRGAGAVWSGTSYELTPYGSSVATDAFLQAIHGRPLNAHGVRAP